MHRGRARRRGRFQNPEFGLIVIVLELVLLLDLSCCRQGGNLKEAS
jgi:hypothetical protein